MEWIRWSAPYSFVVIALFVAGLVLTFTLGLRRSSPAAVALSFAVAILAIGVVSFATGVEHIERILKNFPPEERPDLMATGSREATAMLLWCAVGALILAAAGGGLALASKRAKD